MSVPAEMSQAVAYWLARIWEYHKPKSFAEYIGATYGKYPEALPSIDCVYIAEAKSGDLDAGQIGSIIKRWWKLDDTGLILIRMPSLPPLNEAILFDPRPIVKFYTDGERVVFGERLGSSLICRKVGNLVVTGTSVSIENIRLIWRANG
jgi:hypothetical protein